MSSKTNFCMFNFRLLCSIKINKQNKGFGRRNTFRRIRKGERGVMDSQNGWMVRWGRWNGWRRRLLVPAVSSNPHTQMQCFTSLSLAVCNGASFLQLCSTPPLQVSITFETLSVFRSLFFTLQNQSSRTCKQTFIKAFARKN